LAHTRNDRVPLFDGEYAIFKEQLYNNLYQIDNAK